MNDGNDGADGTIRSLATFRAHLMQLPQGAEIGHSEFIRTSLNQSTESWEAFVDGLVQEYAIRIDGTGIMYAAAPNLSSVIDLALDSSSRLGVRLSDVKSAFIVNFRTAILGACENGSEDRDELLTRVRVTLMDLLKGSWSSGQWFDMGRHLALKIAKSTGNPVIDTQMQLVLANCLVMSEEAPAFEYEIMRRVMTLRIRLVDAILARDLELATAIYEEVQYALNKSESTTTVVAAI